MNVSSFGGLLRGFLCGIKYNLGPQIRAVLGCPAPVRTIRLGSGAGGSAARGGRSRWQRAPLAAPVLRCTCDDGRLLDPLRCADRGGRAGRGVRLLAIPVFLFLILRV